MGDNRYALVITCNEYSNSKLRPLNSTQQDAVNLQRVLSDTAIGNFSVSAYSNKEHYEVQEIIHEFVVDRKPGDLLLIYFSGHGLKDNDGRLYFATKNTRTERLETSAVPAALVHKLIHQCRAKRKILILDCCYGGAYIRGIISKGDNKIGIKDQFEDGSGLIVLTASDSMQYAFEGQNIKGNISSSVFTGLLVEGIEKGEADIDRDGLVGVTELYKYISGRIAEERPEQRPEITNISGHGEVYIAKSKNIAITVTLSWDEAIQGGDKIIKVNEYERSINIPQNVTNRSEHKYCGQGLPINEIINGDLFITFIIQKPLTPPVSTKDRVRFMILAISVIVIITTLIFRNQPIKNENVQHDTLTTNKNKEAYKTIHGKLPPAHMRSDKNEVSRSLTSERSRLLNEKNIPFIGREKMRSDSALIKIVNWLDVEHSARYQSIGTVTFPNVYACDYCYLANVYLPRVWWSGNAIRKMNEGESVIQKYGETIYEVTANGIFSWLNDFGPLYGWRQVYDLDTLQILSNSGHVAIICGRRKNLSLSGFISLVLPEIEKNAIRHDSHVITPLQSFAGVKNYKYSLSNWFKDTTNFTVGFWIHY